MNYSLLWKNNIINKIFIYLKSHYLFWYRNTLQTYGRKCICYYLLLYLKIIFVFVGNTLEKALNKIGREDIVRKCIFNVELVTDDVEKAVARVRLDQPGFDSLKEELGPSRDTSLRRDATMDPKMNPDYDDYNKSKVCILEKQSVSRCNLYFTSMFYFWSYVFYYFIRKRILIEIIYSPLRNLDPWKTSISVTLNAIHVCTFYYVI